MCHQSRLEAHLFRFLISHSLHSRAEVFWRRAAGQPRHFQKITQFCSLKVDQSENRIRNSTAVILLARAKAVRSCPDQIGPFLPS